MALTTQTTAFSRDVVGRYTCNTLVEALASADPTSPGGHPAARPFDVIVLGGGAFGSVVASHLLGADRARRRRALVLEGGPVLLPEHVQNLPMLGLRVPGATSIADLRAAGQATTAREEVWGLAWHSPQRFTGLAYCLGGRSVYWGGWAPFPLDEELSPAEWPKPVVADLTGNGAGPGHLARSAAQLGVDETNDFIFGTLQNALRARLYDAVAGDRVPGAISLDQLPAHPAATGAASAQTLAELLGVESGDPRRLAGEAKLEAPLAVQASTRPGFFPNNKFSVVPMLVQAARSSWAESGDNNADRRLMVVPQCHVTRLERSGDQVVGVQTSQGHVPVPPGGVVVLALGTIESTRLALDAFTGLPETGPIGAGLTSHLRSNLTIRIPRHALGDLADHELMAAALFLKGKAAAQVDGDRRERFFHLQITAAGLGSLGADSEAELFKKIPDIDTYDRFRTASDTHVVITLRGIGEMDTDNPASRVTLDPEPDEHGVRRAFVMLQPTANDLAVWDAMDACADSAAIAFAGGKGYEVLDGPTFRQVAAGQPPSSVLPRGQWHDGLGTTHHEGGTLRLGEDPASSATDPDCRLHGVANAYVAGPALFPRLGSPNPMLTGVALARRLAEHLGRADRYSAPDGYPVLFDGVDLSGWRMAGPGRFLLVDGALQAVPGADLGMLWCVTPTPPDFSLRLQYRLSRPDDNAGVFIRFPDPTGKGYQNPAWVAVHFGFEAQIDDTAPLDKHRTGAIYDVDDQRYTPPPASGDDWNDYEIQARGQTYTVLLNGQQTTRHTNPDPSRGAPSTAQAPSHIGVQSHTGRVEFRHVRVKAL